MSFITQGKANLKYTLIIVILAAIAGGGILGYQYWWMSKKEGVTFSPRQTSLMASMTFKEYENMKRISPYNASSPFIIITRLIPVAFMVFIVVPIIGLVWYRKKGGKKTWPKAVVWILASFFILVLVFLVFFTYIGLTY
jgi:hypothetical protein